VNSEGKDSRIFSGTKGVNKGLTHEQTDGNSNGDSYHSATNVYTATIGSYPTCLRQSGLGNNESTLKGRTSSIR